MVKVRVLLVALISLLILGSCSTSANVPTDKTISMTSSEAWNSCCGTYSFPDLNSATLAGTFESEYFGDDFETDFAGVKAKMAELMVYPVPGWVDDDPLRFSVNNY